MVMLFIDENTTVRDMLLAYPDTFDILLSHGMCSECKAKPPPVSLKHFAQKHCNGDIKHLLEDLRHRVHEANVPAKATKREG